MLHSIGEFRHLWMAGTPIVYSNTLVRLIANFNHQWRLPSVDDDPIHRWQALSLISVNTSIVSLSYRVALVAVLGLLRTGLSPVNW